jgi:AcrR family transcriptional regulator
VTSQPKRSWDEVQDLVVAAARPLFETQGYAGTSTREIARRAGVTQAAIFRHFGSKERLFEAVILAPLCDYLDSFVERWNDDARWKVPREQRTHEYIAGLWDLVQRNRPLFAQLIDHRVGTAARIGAADGTATLCDSDATLVNGSTIAIDRAASAGFIASSMVLMSCAELLPG